MPAIKGNLIILPDGRATGGGASLDLYNRQLAAHPEIPSGPAGVPQKQALATYVRDHASLLDWVQDAGGGGSAPTWETVYEVDFSKQPSQDLDDTFSGPRVSASKIIDNRSWSVISGADNGSGFGALKLVNGEGIKFSGGASGATSPAIYASIYSLLPYYSDQGYYVRVTAVMSQCDNCSINPIFGSASYPVFGMQSEFAFRVPVLTGSSIRSLGLASRDGTYVGFGNEDQSSISGFDPVAHQVPQLRYAPDNDTLAIVWEGPIGAYELWSGVSGETLPTDFPTYIGSGLSTGSSDNVELPIVFFWLIPGALPRPTVTWSRLRVEVMRKTPASALPGNQTESTGSGGSGGSGGGSGSGGSGSATIGPPGPSGPVGPAGPTGAPGATGSVGPAGATGADGATGAAGSAGATGAAGTNGAGYGGTSTTSFAISGTGSFNFTTQSGLAYVVGSRVRAAASASPTNYLEGIVTSYSGTSLVFAADNAGGSGTFAAWDFSIAGDKGATGATGATGAPGGGGGGPAWTSLYDLDFSSLTTQTLSSGSATIDGKTWQVVNSSAAASFGVVNGTGLQIVCNSTSGSYTARTAPMIYLPLAQFTTSFSILQLLRVSVQLTLTNAGHNFEGAYAGLETSSGSPLDQSAVLYKGHNPSTSNTFQAITVISASASGFDEDSSNFSDDVISLVFQFPTGAEARTGVYSSGWPSTTNLRSSFQMDMSNPKWLKPASFRIIMGVATVNTLNSGTTAVFKRLKVESLNIANTA